MRAGTNGVSVFDASTCNATVQSGCDQLGLLPAAFPPFGVQVDPANQTLYTADGDNTISAFDLRSCNAADLAGCATDTPGIVTLPAPGFEVTLWVAVDPANHSVYVTNQKDDAVIVVNANVCNGSDLAGCATLDPPEIHTGADPEILTLDPDTQTLYTANQVDNDVSVIDATRCDAQTTSGCRARVPEVPNVSGALATDPAVHTTYVASSATAVAMIDDSTCNAFHAARCAQTPPSVTVGTYPSAVAVDPNTHTVYVADAGAGSTGSVSVFDDRTCNATTQVGCGTVFTQPIPAGNPVGLAVNPRTDTVYVATITSNGGPDLISMFNGATCNASDHSGCDQTPANAPTGDDGGGSGSTESVAVDPATNTVYAASDTLDNPFVGDSVYVINGTTCDAANQTGCNHKPATVTLNQLPSNPSGIRASSPTRSRSQSTRQPTRSTPPTSPTARGPAPSRSSTATSATHTTRAAATRSPPPHQPVSAPAESRSIRRATRFSPPTSRTPASRRSTGTPATQSTPKAVTAHKPKRSSVTIPTRSPSTRPSRPPTSPTAKASR